MLLSPRKNGLTSLFEEVRVFKVFGADRAISKTGRFLVRLKSWGWGSFFFPVMFLSKITELIVGECSSGNSLQDFVHGISVRASWDR